MKQLFTLLVAVMLSINSFSQVEQVPPPAAIKDSIYTVVQIPPEFPGGLAAWNKYIIRNFDSMPDSALLTGPTIVCSFIVHKDGRLSDFVIKNPKEGRGKAEAAYLNLLKCSPNWKPAINNGRCVSYRHIQSITICLVEE